MKNKIVFIVGVLFAANAGYSGSQYSADQNNNGGYIFNGESTEIWSGSWEDLKAVVEDAKEKYGYENFTHLGRNATMLVPANWAQMQLFINRGNPEGWSKYFWDGFHVPEAKKDDDWIEAGIRSFNDRIVKYTNPSGGEVIYDKKTCKIILDKKLGTKNLGYEYTLLSNVIKEEASIVCALNPGCTVAKIVEKLTDEWNKFRSHKVKDVTKHSENDQYKYAGILFEVDLDDPTKHYIIDGQTGKRMTKNQVKVFPTTMSDMWKNSGPFCVKEDAEIIIPSRSNVFNSDLKSITRVQGEDEVSGIKSLTNNIAKTDVDEAKAMGDKCDVIKAIEQLISCMKERNAAVDSVSRRLPKRSMSDIRGILSCGDAISAESARYAERVEKCIETLNVSFLKMEKEFSNDSTVQINAIREKRYNSIKPHIIELFEILRDSPDKIRHRVENVIPIQLARCLVNCDNRIRKKYYLLPSFGFEL